MRSYDIIVGGRVAEWLMALVLKTSVRKHRKFESCPFRHFLVSIYLGATGGVDAEIGQNYHFVISDHVSGMKLCVF